MGSSTALQLLSTTARAIDRVVVDAEVGIDDLVGLLKDVRKRGARAILFGNGGSAAIAAHMAVDFVTQAGMRAVSLTNPIAITAAANDQGMEYVFDSSLRAVGVLGDVAIALSCSGKSPSVLTTSRHAKSLGLTIVTLSGMVYDNPLRGIGKINLYVPSSSYGVIQIVHLAILHAVCDALALDKPS
jgi:D-sedoheptulose 7-phosphate isomerase